MRPVGILGGTFDPIHFGHLRPALELCQALGLDHVRLIPARQPPHRSAPVASPEQRAAMAQAAVAGESCLAVDTRELARPGPSYTYDTLSSLRAELGGLSLCLILGSDAFAGLHTWHRWSELIELAHIVVVQRPGAAPLAQGEVAEVLGSRYIEDPAPLHRSPAGCVLRWPVTQLAISATGIRAMIAAGKSPRYLLPDSVWELIKRDAIYRGHDELSAQPGNAGGIPSSPPYP